MRHQRCPRCRRFASVDPRGARGPCRSAREAQHDRRRARPTRRPHRQARAHRRRDASRHVWPSLRTHRRRPRRKPRRPILRSGPERTKKRGASRNDNLDHLPHEEVAIEALHHEAHTRVVPSQQLHAIGALGADHVDSARVWIGGERLLHRRVGLLAQVDGLSRLLVAGDPFHSEWNYTIKPRQLVLTSECP